MTLQAIKRYLQVYQGASLLDIKQGLGMQDIEQLRCMLRQWMAKGRVICETRTPVCGTSCTACPVSRREIYRWQSL